MVASRLAEIKEFIKSSDEGCVLVFERNAPYTDLIDTGPSRRVLELPDPEWDELKSSGCIVWNGGDSWKLV